MKKVIVLVLIAALFLVSCSNKKICIEKNGQSECHTYKYFGIFNEDTNRNPNIQYKPSTCNIILGCLFIETIVVPIIVAGFFLFEPAGPLVDAKDINQKGIVE